jgi:hypothetical protein
MASSRLVPTSSKRAPQKRKRFPVEGEEEEGEDLGTGGSPQHKKKSGRPSILAMYDAEILQLLKYRFTPGQVADALQVKYGLSSRICSPKSIDNRIRYMKLNGASIPPTNSTIDLRAGLCQWEIFFLFYFLF